VYFTPGIVDSSDTSEYTDSENSVLNSTSLTSVPYHDSYVTSDLDTSVIEDFGESTVLETSCDESFKVELVATKTIEVAPPKSLIYGDRIVSRAPIHTVSQIQNRHVPLYKSVY
jgi:hypothetical protein